jgi:hypothetical protein
MESSLDWIGMFHGILDLWNIEAKQQKIVLSWDSNGG